MDVAGGEGQRQTLETTSADGDGESFLGFYDTVVLALLLVAAAGYLYYRRRKEKEVDVSLPKPFIVV